MKVALFMCSVFVLFATGSSDLDTKTMYLVDAGNEVVNGGFETPESTSTGEPVNLDWLPTEYGDWAGDVSNIVTGQNGIAPYEGNRMLHFIYSGPDGPYSGLVASQLYQIIDISEHSSLIASGKALAVASFRVNRVAGDSETDKLFDLEIMAYAGSHSNFPESIDNDELGHAAENLESDSNVATWELLTTQLPLPNSTEYIVIEIDAHEDVVNDGSDPEFDGHYGDDVKVEIFNIETGAKEVSWGKIKAMDK